MSASPVFVGGMFKSGTTLLRAMLGQHPRIASGLETQWFNLDWRDPSDDGFRAHLQRMAAFFELPGDEVLELAAGAAEATTFVDGLMSAVARRQGKPRWAEKTPGNVAHLDEIWQAWPGAQVVHIVRGPKDAYASLKLADKAPTGAVYAQKWCDIMGVNAALKERLRPSTSQSSEIRYEALIFEPESVMRSVLDFLGEDWDEACGRFGGKRDEYDRVLAITGHASTTLERLRQPLTRSRIGIWRDVLSDAEIQEFRHEVGRLGHGDLLDRLERETADLVSP